MPALPTSPRKKYVPPIAVAEEDYLQACDQYMGWCTACKDWLGECCEPDAHHYQCPECGGRTVHGAEEALLMGLITILDRSEESKA